MKTAKLTCELVAFLLLGWQVASAQFKGEIQMTCFPAPPPPGHAPGIGPAPPCLLPTGIPSKFVSPRPKGVARFEVGADDAATFEFEFEGLAPDLVLTAWVSYFFPGPPGTPVPDPIFAPLDPNLSVGEGSPAVAAVSAPLAPTDAQFASGLGQDPNAFRSGQNGRARLLIQLNYNPFKAGQGPLRNGLTAITQSSAPSGSVATQPTCCPNGIPAPRPEPISGAFLRRFDPATGFQARGADGRPELIRSPVPVAFIAIVAHLDEQTHGLTPGIPVLPIPGVPASTGDHFLVGMFDLRRFE